MQTAFYLMKNYAKLVTEEGNDNNFLYVFIRVCKENLSLDNGKSATVTFSSNSIFTKGNALLHITPETYGFIV